MTVVIGVALGQVIGLGSFGGFLAQHHSILRLLIILTVLLCLAALLLLLSLIGLRSLRIAGYAVDHDVLLTPCLSDSRRKVLAPRHHKFSLQMISWFGR